MPQYSFSFLFSFIIFIWVSPSINAQPPWEDEDLQGAFMNAPQLRALLAKAPSDEDSSRALALAHSLQFMAEEVLPEPQSIARQAATFLVSGTAGGLAAMVTSQVFIADPVLYTYWHIRNNNEGDAAGFPTMTFMIAPHAHTFKDMLDWMGPRSEARKACRQPLSWKYILAQIGNGAAAVIFTGKAAVVAYNSIWGTDGQVPSDYPAFPLYLIANIASNVKVLGRKIDHFIPRGVDSAHIKAKRTMIQTRMVGAYRQIASLPDEEVVGFLRFVKGLEESCPGKDHTAFKTLLLLAYMDGLVEAGIETRVVKTPLGYKVARGIGGACGALPFLAYYFAGYFAGDSLCALSGQCSEDIHQEDVHMDRWSSHLYAIFSTIYGTYAGALAGANTAGNLYCLATKSDPNMWGEKKHLEYYSRANAGLQALMGFVAWGGSMVVKVPKAGLATHQLFELNAPVALQQAALYMGAIGYSFSQYLGECGPAYHALVDSALHVRARPSRGDLDRLRAKMQNMAVGFNHSIGKMNGESIARVAKLLDDIRVAQAGRHIDLSQLDLVPKAPLLADVELAPLALNGGMNGSASHGLREHLLSEMSHDVESHLPPQPGRWERFKNWFVGEPVPEHLQAAVEEVNSPGWWGHIKNAGSWVKQKCSTCGRRRAPAHSSA